MAPMRRAAFFLLADIAVLMHMYIYIYVLLYDRIQCLYVYSHNVSLKRKAAFFWLAGIAAFLHIYGT